MAQGGDKRESRDYRWCFNHFTISKREDEEPPSQNHGSINPATGDEHIYSVTKIGGRYKSRFDIRSNLDEIEIVTPNEEKCAENVMAALADFDKGKLNAILDLTDQEAKGYEMHKKIQLDIDKYIKGYSFWNVRVDQTKARTQFPFPQM